LQVCIRTATQSWHVLLVPILRESVQKEVNLSSLHHQEKKEMTKLFHIKIQVKKTKTDALFDSGSHANLIAADPVNKFGLEVHNHPSPYSLGWVNKDAKINVTNNVRLNFL
jgi:hypothetical protein